MTPSEELTNRFVGRLRLLGLIKPCPRCFKKEFQATCDTRLYAGHGLGIPVGLIMCSQCGFCSTFVLQVLGIEIPQPAPPSEDKPSPS